MKKFILYLVLLCCGIFGVIGTLIAMAIDGGDYYNNPFDTFNALFILMFVIGLWLTINNIRKDSKKNKKEV